LAKVLACGDLEAPPVVVATAAASLAAAILSSLNKIKKH
jgi:hypothetical protein